MLVCTQPPPGKPGTKCTTRTDVSEGLRAVSVGSYSYAITPEDLQTEQEAFEAGEGVRSIKQCIYYCWYLHNLPFHRNESLSRVLGCM